METKQDFESSYMKLNDQLGDLYEELRSMKANNYRNNEKLSISKEKIDALSREVDRLRETFKQEYEIHELIKSVETTYEFLLDDIRGLYRKPRRVNLIPNYGATKKRSASFSVLNRIKSPFSRIRSGSAGGKRKKTRRR